MNVTVTHVDGMVFAGVGQSGEFTKIVSKPMDPDQQGTSPMELVLMGIAGCSGIDIVDMLEKMRISFERFEINVNGERAEEFPRVFTDIQVDYKFWGTDLPENRLRRAIELSMDKYCSVINMVNKVAKVTYTLEIQS